MQKKAHILYVEDDRYLSFVTKDNLELMGYNITCCEDGEQAIDLFIRNHFDICIIDIMLPKIDGFTVATKIRDMDHHIPIIFLTAKTMKEDRIKGLTIGGDDYMTKPFNIEELVLKIEIFLRRNRVKEEHSECFSPLRIGSFIFDYKNQLLNLKGEQIRLTQKEADLLKFLNENRNRVLKREDILISVWGNDSYYLSRSLDVFISRLRKILRKDRRIKIKNIHGTGFALTVAADAD
ncbi:MAG: response regulator transcription factor [Bacteroidetes bacterium]|nr:response regulator transcription factor [Bacteroidota bacterium]